MAPEPCFHFGLTVFVNVQDFSLLKSGLLSSSSLTGRCPDMVVCSTDGFVIVVACIKPQFQIFKNNANSSEFSDDTKLR